MRVAYRRRPLLDLVVVDRWRMECVGGRIKDNFEYLTKLLTALDHRMLLTNLYLICLESRET